MHRHHALFKKFQVSRDDDRMRNPRTLHFCSWDTSRSNKDTGNSPTTYILYSERGTQLPWIRRLISLVYKKKSQISTPLYALTVNVDFKWSDKCGTTFTDLKKLVSTTPVLCGPNQELPFHISTNASDVAVVVVLGQEEDKKPYVIYYISKNLTAGELNYIVTKKEFLDVIDVINIFIHYITLYQVFLYTDHSAITYLSNKPITNRRVTRWLLLLQEFDITIKDWPGKENPIANFLSQVPKINDPLGVADQFIDKHLFIVVTKMPWYADVTNYLVVGKLPRHLTAREGKQIVQHNA